MAMAAARLHPPRVQPEADAGDAAGQEDDVRGRLAEPGAVHVHGVPAPVRHPVAGGQVVRDVAGPAAHGVHRQGVQRDGGVLLGALPAAVQRRRRRGAQDLRPHGAQRLHRAPRPALGGRPRPRLQHLPLVVHRPALQGHERAHRGGQGGGGGVGVHGGGLRHGVPGHAAVGEGQHGLQRHQGLLHQHVAHPRQEPGLGGGGGGELLQRDGDDRGRRVLGHGRAAERDAGDQGDPGRRRRRRAAHVPQRHADVHVPQGRAHLHLQEAVEPADAGAGGRPQDLRRLRPLVPPGPPGHLERTSVHQALLPLITFF